MHRRTYTVPHVCLKPHWTKLLCLDWGSEGGLQLGKNLTRIHSTVQHSSRYLPLCRDANRELTEHRTRCSAQPMAEFVKVIEWISRTCSSYNNLISKFWDFYSMLDWPVSMLFAKLLMVLNIQKQGSDHLILSDYLITYHTQLGQFPSL